MFTSRVENEVLVLPVVVALALGEFIDIESSTGQKLFLFIAK